MNFFEHQDRARRNTKWLVVYFVAAVALMIVTIYAVCAAFLPGTGRFWNAELFGTVSLVTILIVLGGSLAKTAALRQGGSAVATMLGGRPVDPNTSDLNERKLLNVVEEMAIASGIPVPTVYVLAEEEGINAFAAGLTTSDAVVGVTRGCMTLLSRDELQGVIAHEFSHILNGDMRLNLRLIGLIFGIFCLSVFGRILLQTSGRRSSSSDGKKGGNPLPLIGLALMLIGAIGVFFGRLIKSAVSRQREFLADAAAVQFTRNPAGLAGALKKIGGLQQGSRLDSAHAEEASHLFFSNALRESFTGFMATHPPLPDRIRRLDPTFDGHFERLLPAQESEAFVSMLSPAQPPKVPPPVPAASAEAVVPLIGAPTPTQINYAAEFTGRLPDALSEAAHDPMSATALVYAMLLSRDEHTRQNQVQSAGIAEELVKELQRLAPEIERLDVAYRLPLVQMALPALSRLSPAQYTEFDRTIQTLIESDEQVDLFEYALQKIVRRHLSSRFVLQRPPVVQFYSIRPLLPDCAVLLSIISHSGHDDPIAAQKAFAAGARRFGSGNPVQMLELSSCGLDAVDVALGRLAQSSPAIKKTVIDACALAAATDGCLRVYEAELLRAIADTLGCPIPPFIHGV
jgi:Zn-dependent protease with chaperone function